MIGRLYFVSVIGRLRFVNLIGRLCFVGLIGRLCFVNLIGRFGCLKHFVLFVPFCGLISLCLFVANESRGRVWRRRQM